MRSKAFTARQIFDAIRQIKAGASIESVCEMLQLSRTTLYSWRKKYSHLSLEALHEVLVLEMKMSKLRTELSNLLKDRGVLLRVLAGTARNSTEG